MSTPSSSPSPALHPRLHWTSGPRTPAHSRERGATLRFYTVMVTVPAYPGSAELVACLLSLPQPRPCDPGEPGSCFPNLGVRAKSQYSDWTVWGRCPVALQEQFGPNRAHHSTVWPLGWRWVGPEAAALAWAPDCLGWNPSSAHASSCVTLNHHSISRASVSGQDRDPVGTNGLIFMAA